jgi:hypothetical protein
MKTTQWIPMRVGAAMLLAFMAAGVVADNPSTSVDLKNTHSALGQDRAAVENTDNTIKFSEYPTGTPITSQHPSRGLISGNGSPACRDPNSGIWDIWGVMDYGPYPWVKGSLITVVWKDIEVRDGVYDFSKLDARMKDLFRQNKRSAVMVYHGDAAPAWVIDRVGVSKIIAGKKHPNYLDPEYGRLFYRLTNAVAHHLKNWPDAEELAQIGYIQAPVGKSGDKQPWNGWRGEEPISKAQWDDWTRKTIANYVQAYRGSGIRVLFNYAGGAASTSPRSYAEEIREFNWIMSLAPGSALKSGRPAHRHDKPFEKWQTEFALKVLRPNNVFVRGEMDAYDRATLRFDDPAITTRLYYNALFLLTIGLDQWNLRPKELSRLTTAQLNALVPVFNFFNNYAGFENGREIPGAFIAFRDALDASDTERFPESVYGSYETDRPGSIGAAPTETNRNRFNAIANTFARYGARMDDNTDRMFIGGVPYYGSAEAKNLGWNDVKFALYSTDYRAQNDGAKLLGSGNYENFITMIDPRGTSQGRWRVGPVTHPYHQWAREFNAARSPMRLQLDATFAGSLSGDLRMYVRYFDEGSGSWRLTYSSVDNPNKTALTVVNTNTNTWKEVVVTVDDYKFTRSGPSGSDLGLEYVSGDNTAFHMIEIQTDRPFSGVTCEVPPSHLLLQQVSNSH